MIFKEQQMLIGELEPVDRQHGLAALARSTAAACSAAADADCRVRLGANVWGAWQGPGRLVPPCAEWQ